LQKKSFAKRLESTSIDKGSILTPFLFVFFLLNCSLWFLFALIIAIRRDWEHAAIGITATSAAISGRSDAEEAIL
jgi:predicted permease